DSQCPQATPGQDQNLYPSEPCSQIPRGLTSQATLLPDPSPPSLHRSTTNPEYSPNQTAKYPRAPRALRPCGSPRRFSPADRSTLARLRPLPASAKRPAPPACGT